MAKTNRILKGRKVVRLFPYKHLDHEYVFSEAVGPEIPPLHQPLPRGEGSKEVPHP